MPQPHSVIDVFKAHRIFNHAVEAPVNRDSRVVASLTEVALDGAGPRPHLGDATMKVYNVAPQDNGTVLVRGEVDWDDDLDIRVSLIILDAD